MVKEIGNIIWFLGSSNPAFSIFKGGDMIHDKNGKIVHEILPRYCSRQIDLDMDFIMQIIGH